MTVLPDAPRCILRAALLSLFVFFAAVLLIRSAAGHDIAGRFGIRSPLNPESFLALSFLLLLFTSRRMPQQQTFPRAAATPRQLYLAFAIIAGVSLACFGWSLSTPFLFDDYGHVALASTASLRTVLVAFFHPHPDIFFRPLGFFSYYVDFQWARFDPFRWHCWNLAIHIANCFLVYLLARLLALSHAASTFAAAFFALHGTRAETVSWTDARFDLLVTLFILLALVSCKLYARGGRGFWLGIALGTSLLACFTKEAAFSLPLLVVALIPLTEPAESRKLKRTALLIAAECVLLFVYRWWMIGGVGGYQSGSHANVLNFSVVRSIKALAWRLWAVLFFPINWVSGAGFWLTLGILLLTIVLGICSLKARLDIRRAAIFLAMVVLAALPVQHLLLIGTALADARLLYLPLLGFALFWAALFDANQENRALQYALVGALLFLNIAALEHNIRTWRTVAQTARQVCHNFGGQISSLGGPVAVSAVPDRLLGVYFLKNGFAECVQQNSGVTADRIILAPTVLPAAGLPAGAPRFVWNAEALRFDRAR